ncbi:MAG: right-handed parallel beta-helix repeat-containing protein, partial [Bacteroidota bacterium]
MAGVVMYGSDVPLLEGNSIFDNVNHGIYFATYFGEAANNTIYSNGAFGYFSGTFDNPAGISMPWGDNNFIHDNIVANNVRFGIRIPGSQDNLIMDNTVGAATVTATQSSYRNWESFIAKINPERRTTAAQRVKAYDEQEEKTLQEKHAKGVKKADVEAEKSERNHKAIATSKAAWEQLKAEHLTSHTRNVPEASQVDGKRTRPNAKSFEAKARPTQKRAVSATRMNRLTPPLLQQTELTLPGNFVHGIKIEDDYNVVTGNLITDNGSAYVDVNDFDVPYPAGIELTYADYTEVDSNFVQNNHFAGISFTNYSSENTVTLNTISGNGFSSNGKGAGILVRNDAYSNTFEHNVISGNLGDGIRIDDLYGSSYNNSINYNNIIDNTQAGISNQNYYENEVNAENNWWGDALGPRAKSVNGIVGFVDFTPWLDGPFDTGNPVEVTLPGVIRNVNTNTTYLSISEAVGAANDGDVIEVGAGFY